MNKNKKKFRIFYKGENDELISVPINEYSQEGGFVIFLTDCNRIAIPINRIIKIKSSSEVDQNE